MWLKTNLFFLARSEQETMKCNSTKCIIVVIVVVVVVIVVVVTLSSFMSHFFKDTQHTHNHHRNGNHDENTNSNESNNNIGMRNYMNKTSIINDLHTYMDVKKHTKWLRSCGGTNTDR